MGKWLFRKDSPRVDATPDYKCKEILLPEKIEKTAKELYEEWLDGYIANGGKVTAQTHGFSPLFNTADRNSLSAETIYVVREDGCLGTDSHSNCALFIVLEGVSLYIPKESSAKVFYMEDFSFESQPYNTVYVYNDSPHYEMIKERNILEVEKVAKQREQEAERKHQKSLKEFDSFAKKVKSTQDLGVHKSFGYACRPRSACGTYTYYAERQYSKEIIISHLSKKTTICSGDKNYSMTIYVTPQAYLKIEKDTGTGTIITVSDEVAAALVGDK